MRPNRIRLAAVAATAAVALSACAGSAPAGEPAPSAPASTTPAASAPLGCDDLAPADLVAATLAGADGEAEEPVDAVNGSDAMSGVLVEGVGGLACSWRVGGGMPEYGAPSDWAYLRIDVLPGAADDWVPLQLGDSVSPDTRDVAGVEASVAGGDPGWSLSAPVGEHWVVASISAAGLTAEGGRFAGIGGAVMIERLVAVAETAFEALDSAQAEQLAELGRPVVDLREGAAACTGRLDQAAVVDALQVRDPAVVAYETTDAAAAPPRDFDHAVRAAARTFDCTVLVDGGPRVVVTVAPGFAVLFDRFGEPDADVTFEPLDLGGVPDGVDASALVRPATGDASASPAVLAVDGALHLIRGDRVEGVARAIVAGAG
ncbi:hypothetical protein [Agromyces arachidis]|uniref:hypothetical protein n=1 Tax=Agromyces arachidis TaxID=766966 RepID=UPI0040575ACA